MKPKIDSTFNQFSICTKVVTLKYQSMITCKCIWKHLSTEKTLDVTVQIWVLSVSKTRNANCLKYSI